MRSPSSWRGCVKGLAEQAEKASGDAKASLGVFNGQSEHLDIVTRECGADGTERKKLSEAITALEKNLALIRTNLASHRTARPCER
jgi:hypothetical protein